MRSKRNEQNGSMVKIFKEHPWFHRSDRSCKKGPGRFCGLFKSLTKLLQGDSGGPVNEQRLDSQPGHSTCSTIQSEAFVDRRTVERTIAVSFMHKPWVTGKEFSFQSRPIN